jgi:hypothetical protein
MATKLEVVEVVQGVEVIGGTSLPFLDRLVDLDYLAANSSASEKKNRASRSAFSSESEP